MIGPFATPNEGSFVLDGSVGSSFVFRISPKGAVFRRVCSASIVIYWTSLIHVFADVSCVDGIYRSLTVRVQVANMILVPFVGHGQCECGFSI